MFFKQNKALILGTVAVAGLWLMLYFVFVRSNWTAAADKLADAEQGREAWDKNFNDGAKLLPKDEAENVLKENNRLLNANLQTLQKMELGTRDTLHAYTEAAAGQGDHKGYLDQKRITIVNKANEALHVTVPKDLGILGGKAGDDPVAVNLLRLAVVDTFINACYKASVPGITKFQHFAPRLVHFDNEDQGAAGEAEKKGGGEGAPEKAEAQASRLVQFPMKVALSAPERSLGKLLFELQRPTDQSHGYLCLRGFQVAVRDSASGMVEVVLGVSGLVNEKFVRDQGIKFKEEEGRGGPRREVDLNRPW
ncbi:MAG: hypothetical protein NTW87_16445 [Planctomycetota bacterium]|nr:hypothetical protein [Planctomycetota bacterium]